MEVNGTDIENAVRLLLADGRHYSRRYMLRVIPGTFDQRYAAVERMLDRDEIIESYDPDGQEWLHAK
jgi:hypothetical protein